MSHRSVSPHLGSHFHVLNFLCHHHLTVSLPLCFLLGFFPLAAMMRQAHGLSSLESEGIFPSLAMAVTSDGDVPEIKPLTRKNLARLNALHGTIEDNDIDSAYLFDGDSDDDTMKKISTTDSGFEQRAYENGILDPHSSRPPQSLDTIRHSLTRRRTSTQPSEHAHQVYCTRISESYSKARAALLVHLKILRDYDETDLNYGKHCSRAITEIPSQDFNKGLSNPLPDVLEGLRTKVLPDHLYDNALHTKDSLSFCHFAAEFKRTDGNLRQATVQAAYDGAVLVNARDRALAKARQDGTVAAIAIDKAAKEAAVFTCVTDGTVAEVYTHYSEGGQYYQNLVARESLLSYPNRGRKLIRKYPRLRTE